jgi:CubicO group peptidase (beta-lactamase class C family)
MPPTHLQTSPQHLQAHQIGGTLEELDKGIDAGLHLGGQLYLSLHGCSLDLAFGERAPGQAMTSDTLMIWLSSSKPVTAVALAQLWEANLLELDDPIAKHVPEFAARGKGSITLRHALTHTGGFRMLNVGWPEASWQEIIAAICAAKPEPRWVPGEKAGYHMTSSWFMLGEVVQRITGRLFGEYVRTEIFEPLGMHDSWIGMPPDIFATQRHRLGKMYGTEKGSPTPRGWDRAAHVTGCSPGGNGYGPIRDLGRFYQMLLGRGIAGDNRILSAQSVEALTTPHRVGMRDQTFKHILDWGLGFIINSEHYGAATVPYGYGSHASRRTFGHSGFQSSTAFADPEHNLVVALVLNGQPGEASHTERIRRLSEAIYKDLELVDPAGLTRSKAKEKSQP